MVRKRMTDIEKWKKKWFRKLKPKYKCFWFYVCDNCDHAGIWEVDFEAASYHIGVEITEKDIIDLFDKQFYRIDNDKWYIVDFVDFQYRILKDTNNAHKSVINILKKYNLLNNQGLGRGLKGGWAADQEQDKEKDKVKEKVKDKDKPWICNKCNKLFSPKEYIELFCKCDKCDNKLIEINNNK